MKSLGVLTVALLGAGVLGQQPAPADRLNVLLIVSDDHRTVLFGKWHLGSDKVEELVDLWQRWNRRLARPLWTPPRA